VIGKVDLVMWTFNGQATLPIVFKQIDKVIPKEHIGKKIVSDDGSIDKTVEIAKSFGWTVYPNEGKGISDGANTALKNVESEFFVSFEQDLLLSPNWWSKIPNLLSDSKVAAASGMRFADKPQGVKKLQMYVAK
jgi:glycosyltransferase involved in cell wall biosynthesis